MALMKFLKKRQRSGEDANMWTRLANSAARDSFTNLERGFLNKNRGDAISEQSEILAGMYPDGEQNH